MLLLGDQLIRDSGIAVFELVKNAYDADASLCSVTLHDVQQDSSESRIVVEDDGEGMDIETVQNVWLSPGTRNRLTQREQKDQKKARSKKFKRLPLGEKGVGRFAVHKLGNQVELITRSKGCDEVVVAIDWNQFDSDRPLDSVPVALTTREPEVFCGRQSGTRIVITDLRERPWTRRRVRALHRAVTSICSPIQGPEAFEATIELDPDPSNWLTGMLTPAEVMKLALFRCKGRIEGNQIVYSYSFRPPAGMDRVEPRQERNKRVAFVVSKEEQATLEDDDSTTAISSQGIGPIAFEFSVFDRERKTLRLMPGDSKSLTDFLDTNGGVRVFREGVRVYDFGEPGNDWLDLGGRRVNVPTKRIGNNQIVGLVRLDLDESSALVEKTNREGFVENYAYDVFKEAVGAAIKQTESERNKDKERIRQAYSKPSQKEPVLGDLQALQDEVDSLDLGKEADKQLKKYIGQIDSQYREMLDRLLTAAGAGLNLAIVLHEVDKHIGALHESIVRRDSIGDIEKRAKQLCDVVDSLTWITRQSGKSNVTAKDLIKHCMFAWNFRFDRHEVAVTNGLLEEDPEFTVRCNRRLILTALMNLVDNSIYWLQTKAKKRELYLGTTFELSDKPALVVADNGPGFSDPYEYLTMAFYTRKPDGMGLGLHLADEIMKAEGGRLMFPEPGDVTLPPEFTGAVVALEFKEEKK